MFGNLLNIALDNFNYKVALSCWNYPSKFGGLENLSYLSCM